MRLLNLPRLTIQWYRDRIRRVKARQVAAWAIAELVCMTLSITGVIMAAIVLLSRAVTQASAGWISDILLPILLGGAVGYLTNLIAVTMLFRPYDENDLHPVGILPGWKIGLIPRNRQHLGESAGRQVAENLLTPEVIASELKVLVQQAVQSERMQEELRLTLGPVIRQSLPGAIDRITPELMGFLRDLVSQNMTRNNIDDLFDRVVDPWLRHGTNRETLVSFVIEQLRATLPSLLKQLERLANEYASERWLRRFALWAAERSRTLDWNEIRKTCDQKLDDARFREQLLNGLEELYLEMRQKATGSDMADVIAEMQERASDFLVGVVERQLSDKLPSLGHRIADNPAFWRWLSNDMIPQIQPYVLRYLDGDGIQAIKEHVDIAGRVEEAIAQMDMCDLQKMVNDVSARHLGAIQVLGYGLGIFAGLALICT